MKLRKVLVLGLSCCLVDRRISEFKLKKQSLINQFDSFCRVGVDPEEELKKDFTPVNKLMLFIEKLLQVYFIFRMHYVPKSFRF